MLVPRRVMNEDMLGDQMSGEKNEHGNCIGC